MVYYSPGHYGNTYRQCRPFMLYWMLILLFGIIVITVITERSRGGIDLFVLLLACMLLVMQFVHLGIHDSLPATAQKRKVADLHAIAKKNYSKETFEDAPNTQQLIERKRKTENGIEDINDILEGLTVYVSCFSSESYPKTGGKLWKNIMASETEGKSDPHFHFAKSPGFTRRDGFRTLNNKITGPYSFELGINADLTFTIFMLCQFQGDLPNAQTQNDSNNGGTADMFKIFANTPGNNGISLMAYDAHPDTQNSRSMVRSLGLKVRFGEDIVVECKTKEGGPIEVEKSHGYLIAVSKSSDDRLTVRMVDVSSSYPEVLLLADEAMSSEIATSVSFSNKDMVINEGGLWNAHLQVFGCYDRSVSERDIVRLYDHYKAILETFDPTYVRLMDTISNLSKNNDCPFDEKTCSACRADLIDGDWGNMQNLITSSTTCRKAVGTFCAQNPKHPRCTCWSVTHPEYSSRCKPYRCLFGNEFECTDKEMQQKLKDLEEKNNRFENYGKRDVSNGENDAEIKSMLSKILKDEKKADKFLQSKSQDGKDKKVKTKKKSNKNTTTTNTTNTKSKKSEKSEKSDKDTGGRDKEKDELNSDSGNEKIEDGEEPAPGTPLSISKTGDEPLSSSPSPFSTQQDEILQPHQSHPKSKDDLSRGQQSFGSVGIENTDTDTDTQGGGSIFGRLANWWNSTD